MTFQNYRFLNFPISVVIHNNKKNKIMFTVGQIDTAHSKVKSGADFPKYIQSSAGTL